MNSVWLFSFFTHHFKIKYEFQKALTSNIYSDLFGESLALSNVINILLVVWIKKEEEKYVAFQKCFLMYVWD